MVQGIANVEKERSIVPDRFRIGAKLGSDVFMRFARQQSRLEFLTLAKLRRVMVPVGLVNGGKVCLDRSELFFVIAGGQQTQKQQVIGANWMIVLPAWPERLRPMAKHFHYAIESPMRQA